MIKQRIRTLGIGRNVVRNLNTFHDPNVTLPTRDHLEAHIFISFTLMPFILLLKRDRLMIFFVFNWKG